jgi:hypothetical protein
MKRKFWILILVNLFLAGAAFAQPREFAAASMNPIPMGPTTASQTAALLANTTGSTFVPTNPQITVTASVSNQQYVGENTSPDNAVVMFGATDNPILDGGSNARPMPTFARMDTLGQPVNAQFTNRTDGTPGGIEVDVNYAFNLFTSVQHFKDMAVPSTNNQRIYMANLTLTFSQAVSNPYLHLVALGARTGSINGSPILGFSTEFTLLTQGITLQKLTGNSTLVVDGNNINNMNTNNINVSCANLTAACGTVRLVGNNITSVTFQVYVRGDGGNVNWGSGRFHTGDQWLIGVSLPEVVTSAAGAVTGTLRSGGEPLRKTLVVLYDSETERKMVTRTDEEGIYRFGGLRLGQGYVIQPLSNKYEFSPGNSLVNLVDSVSGLDFGASPKQYRAKNDFDGDGRSDIAVYRPSEGNWYILNSSNRARSVFKFGTSEDRPVAGDFDGDGRADTAVFRPSEGNWYIWQSASQNLRVENFGLANDKLVAADYDGDGKTDIAVFRNGTWFVRKSSDGAVSFINFGIGADAPVAADFDGDGRADVSVYRPGDKTWYVLRSSGNNFSAERFGLEADTPVPADFDGDGAADIAQYRAGNWFIQNSTVGFEGIQFGLATDQTVTADYDGDGRTDTTVYRAGAWFIKNSGSGTIDYIGFGLPTDIVIN